MIEGLRLCLLRYVADDIDRGSDGLVLSEGDRAAISWLYDALRLMAGVVFLDDTGD